MNALNSTCNTTSVRASSPNLYYRIGMGLFTNQEETYFSWISSTFRKSNLPEGWNDEIGGVFRL